ncbi:hypothetical protein LTR04_007418 [Oleoguttula sp. CCFEE 6159]|nr:hypothetical protein LTR04_007418 [Oleoguttula sp. CCFEE 6159]
MASIFTFDPDPPRVSSPWSTPGTSTPKDVKSQILSSEEQATPSMGLCRVLFEDRTVTRLEAEPQEGPTEYKLHLLLRPRRSFTAQSTGRYIPEAKHLPPSRSTSELALGKRPTPPAKVTTHTRQHRLEQLTTQLLWRLQQSSPNHSSSTTSLTIPSLPEATTELRPPSRPGKLLPGLEDSRGALYEIGVSDDGTFVGLAEDEMEESLNNLRAMAATLGCIVDVLRMVPVGDCEWFEDVVSCKDVKRNRRIGKLWVAEAYVKPDGASAKLPDEAADTDMPPYRYVDLQKSRAAGNSAGQKKTSSSTEQLRVTLSGATMSGKSTLLGTLSTATLDNGRGKSRLSMLRHRHEITSGITSSVTQELIGYHETDDSSSPVEVINYASGHVSGWNDIHSLSRPGRLVFLSDSAGHPRYRRTAVRGLVGWAPHWTLLCIAADDAEDTSGKNGSTPSAQEALGTAVADFDLSKAHLDLCLKLDLPLVVVVTKLDLASRSGLRQILAKLLSSLKTAGRKPVILPNATGTVSEGDMQFISGNDLAEARKVATMLEDNPMAVVPIVLTSALRGTSISRLHALLHELPIPAPRSHASLRDTPPSVLFYIEDVYTKSLDAQGSIVSGHLQYGRLSVGNELVLGPYPIDDVSEDSDQSDAQSFRNPRSRLPTSRSFPGALHGRNTLPLRPTQARQEWRCAQVVSIRNLRLPVRTLYAGQVGTIGVVPTSNAAPISTPSMVRIRKGMVLCSGEPQVTSTFVAEFARDDVGSLAVGNLVVVYIASVRATAKILSAQTPDSAPGSRSTASPQRDVDEACAFASLDAENSDGGVRVAGAVTDEKLLVSFHFVASREYVEVGAQVLVMPGGGPGLYGGTERGEKGVAGLEGFVGRVCERFG